MATQGNGAVRQDHGGALIPFGKDDPRRNPGGITKAERDWRRALEDEHIPRASVLLTAVIDRAMRDAESDGTDSPQGPTYAALAFKLMGLMPKGSDRALIQELVRETFQAAIEEAKARREGR